MKAVVIRQFGNPSQLKVEELPTPEPKGDEVLIAVKAASINPSDYKNVMGKMHGTTLPRVPGRDFAGEVVKAGDGARDWIGRNVWGTGGEISRTADGSHAEFLLLPKYAVVTKPASLSMEAAGAAGLSFITAWEAIITVGRAMEGETVVVLGASGGVGAAAVQLAKWRGARVVGTVRSDDAIASVRADGADDVINSRAGNTIEAVRASTANRGADVVFDASGMMFAEAVEIAASDARVPVVAASPDGMCTFNLRTLYRKMLRVEGIDTLRIDARAAAGRLRELLPGFESGKLKSKPGKPMPLSSAIDAYEQAMRGGARIVLTPG